MTTKWRDPRPRGGRGWRCRTGWSRRASRARFAAARPDPVDPAPVAEAAREVGSIHCEVTTFPSASRARTPQSLTTGASVVARDLEHTPLRQVHCDVGVRRPAHVDPRGGPGLLGTAAPSYGRSGKGSPGAASSRPRKAAAQGCGRGSSDPPGSRAAPAARAQSARSIASATAAAVGFSGAKSSKPCG